jgi:hypothetical protein
LQDGKVSKVKLKLGDRDARSGEYVLLGGLVSGDMVIRFPSSALHEGQLAKVSEG